MGIDRLDVGGKFIEPLQICLLVLQKHLNMSAHRAWVLPQTLARPYFLDQLGTNPFQIELLATEVLCRQKDSQPKEALQRSSMRL